jgi:hypothetical protein
VQEEADAVAAAEPAQGGSKRDQVIVVNPHQVAGRDELRQRAGKAFVDAPVTLDGLRVDRCQIETIVKDGPQNAVGEAVVVVLAVLLAERQCRDADAVVMGDAHLCRLAGRDSGAIPAEPHPAVVAQRIE